jgi:TonB family protein
MLAPLFASALAVAAPLTPAGNWLMEVEPNDCAIHRPYGEKQKPIIFGLRTSLISGPLELVILDADHHAGAYHKGGAFVSLKPSNIRLEGAYETGRSEGTGRRFTSIYLESGSFRAVAAATEIEVDIGPKYRFATGNLAKPAAALEGCQHTILKHWGLDDEEFKKVAEQPVLLTPLRDLIKSSDYPEGAIAARRKGTTHVLWRVERDGLVPDCKIIKTSGAADLDALACKLIKKRARYKPAIDKNGQPIGTWQAQKFRWVL